MASTADDLLSRVSKYRYIFKPKNSPVLTRELVGKILDLIGRGITEFTVSLDLGLSSELVKYVSSRSCVQIRGTCIELSKLEGLKESFVYVIKGTALVPVAWYDENLRKYYKLKPVGCDKAPTLEINGVHMHRCEGTDPWRDSMCKVRSLGRLRNAVVLDTCTGLGYTASIAADHGAALVLTSEVDPNVIEIATYNPWSKGLASKGIVTIKADVIEAVRELPDNVFTHVIHDPPRFNIAGELYSRDFYSELYRVLRRGGKLFHYTGMPFKHSNVSMLKGIKRRLELAGFHVIKWVEDAQGFIAVKPS
ncbi:MAG: methyltransferase [Desulfurococcales archaeon]|nr:methyltransferase [Desulfurococcales archaeon]